VEFTGHIRGNIAKWSLTALLLGMMAVGLAACGGADATPTPAAGATDNTGAAGAASGSASNASGATGSGSTQEVKAALNEWSVSLNTAEANAGKVKFVATNEGQFGHNLVVLDSSGSEVGEIPVFKKDESPKEMELDLKAGTYKVVCDVTGHTEKGMTTDFTVK